jgi:hypothetical protein
LPDFEFKKQNKNLEDALNKVYIYLTSMTIRSYEENYMTNLFNLKYNCQRMRCIVPLTMRPVAVGRCHNLWLHSVVIY